MEDATRVIAAVDTAIAENVEDVAALEIRLDDEMRLKVARTAAAMRPLGAESIAMRVDGMVHFEGSNTPETANLRLIVSEIGGIVLQLDHRDIAGHVETAMFGEKEIERSTEGGFAFIPAAEQTHAEWRAEFAPRLGISP